MKKILIFSLAYFPHVGGAEVAIKEITDRISDIEFHLITLRFDSADAAEERIGNVLVHRIGRGSRSRLSKSLFQFRAAFAAHNLHGINCFDAVWAMMAHSAGIPAGLFKAFHPGVTYLLTLQEGDPPEYIERLARPVWPLFKAGFIRAEYLQAISTFLLRWGTHMGFRGVGEVIPNGVDLNHFALTSRRTDARGGTVLVTTSRLVHKNAIDDVIRALPLLPGNILFVIYGIGPDEKMLRQLARGLGVEERTKFMGQITHEEMSRALAAADVFIRPSRSEGMGNSFVEAMAAGLPVIATQEGGIADFLFDAKRNPDKPTTGWAVDKDSPEQIAEAVKDILAHPDKVQNVTATARQMVIGKYDWNLVARQMRALFGQMLEYR